MNTVLTLIVLSVCLQVPTPNYYCEIKETSTANGRQTVKTRKVWASGSNRFRMEVSEKGFVMIHIVSGSDAWVLESQTKTGYHLRKSSSPASPFAYQDGWRRDLTTGPEEWRRMGAKKIGQKTLNGIACDLYRRKEQDGKTTTTVWIPLRSPRLPVQMEASGSLQVGGRLVEFTTRFQFKGWQVRKTMDDALFRPPPDYQVKEEKAKK